MGYKDKFLSGEFPEAGAIFMCNTWTKEECLKRKLFGLPSNMTDLVLNVRKGMTLFLFEYENRLLHGVFRATSDGRINIDPEAFRSSGKHFPAQVRFKTVMNCIPLEEYDFKYVIKDNYYSGNKFKFGLNEKQVSKLLNLFQSKEILKKHPERRGDARSDRYRKNLFRNRLGSINQEDREFEGQDAKNIDDRDRKQKMKREHDSEDRYIPAFTNGRDRKEKIKRKHDIEDCYMPAFTNDHDSKEKIKREHDVEDRYIPDFTNDRDRKEKIRRELDVEDRYIPMFTNDRDRKEKIKREHDVEDPYIPIFSKSCEKHYGEIGVERNNEKLRMDGIDCNRLRFQDEYNVSEGSRKSLSSYHLGSPCDKRSQSVTDKYSFGLETLESSYDGSCTLRPITSTEHTLIKQRETSFGSKPDDADDGSFSFRSVTPSTYSSIREPILTYNYSSSHFSQNAYLTSCDPTCIEPPEIRFSPSHFADGSSFIRVDNSQFYPSSEKIPTVLPLSKSPPYHSHNEGSARYFDDLEYALLGERKQVVEGNREVREFETVSHEEYNPLFPEFVSKKICSTDAGLSLCKDDSAENNKRFCQAHERKHRFGTDKRVSVFARLNSAPRHGNQESETDEKHELDDSVNKVMRMLEKVVSSPIKRKGKSKSAYKDDDDDNNNSRDSEIVDYELPDVPMQLDADLEDEVSEGESVLPETRLLDYKRRKKAIKSIDGSEMSSKRRKIVRPTFVSKTITADDNACYIDNIVPEKVDHESSEKVNAAIKSLDISTLPIYNEKTSEAKDDNNSAKKVDAFMKSIEDIVLSNSNESSPDDSKSTKAVLESSKKVDTSIKYTDTAVHPTSHDILPSKDVSNSTAVCESSEKVDAVEVCSEVEKSGKSGNGPVLDFFVEVTPAASVKDDEKMCGWIEW